MHLVVFSVLAVVSLAADAKGVVNPVLEELLREGVPMSDGSSVRLAEPVAVEQLDAVGQAALLAKISAGGHPVSELVRKSIFAPFVFKVEPVTTPAGKSPGWTVDVYFVAYGNWQTVSSRDFLESLMRPGGQSRGRDRTARIAPLAPEALAQRQIRLKSGPGRKDGYYRVPAKLFDRVELGATWRAVVTRAPGSVTIAARIDPRFNQDREFPNYWRPLVRDAVNPAKLIPSPPHVYAYGGFHGEMMPLAEPAGAILVQCHGVFEEPEGWFQGAPLLRSKLRMLVQERVRSFRGKLAHSAK